MRTSSTRLLALASASSLATAALLVGSGATAQAAPAKARSTSCKSGVLPAEVVGAPAALKAGLPTGVWFWHDGSKYNLRVTHDSKKPNVKPGAPEGALTGTKKTFRGTISTSGKISSIHSYKLERGDSWSVHQPKRNQVRFTFNNYAGLDGLSFKATCGKKVTLKAQVDGLPVQINVGGDPLTIPAAASPARSTSYSVVPAVPSPRGCAAGVLPKSVIGAPAFKAGLPGASWLWHSGSGYQFRVTHNLKVPDTRPGKPVGATRGALKTFEGSISTTTAFGDIKLVKLEGNDALYVKRPRPNLITFKFRNYTGVDGINFKAGCGNITLKVSVDGTPALVHLGKAPTDVAVPAPPATQTVATIARTK